MLHHATSSSNNDSQFPFYNTIVSRSVSRSELMIDAMLKENVLNCIASVLTTSIRPEYLKSNSKLGLNVFNKLSKTL
jgi:hypothetical protein